MKKILLFSFTLVVAASGFYYFKAFDQKIEQSSTAKEVRLNPNLLLEIAEIKEILNNDTLFNANTCESSINTYYDKLLITPPNYFDFKVVTENYDKILTDLFDLKLLLNEKISSFVANKSLNINCLNSLRKSHRVIRYIEDYVILFTKKPAPFDKKDPVAPTLVKDNDTELRVNPKIKNLTLRSGDVLLVRGNTFISASLARIEKEETQFSHISQVFIDAPAGTEIDIVSALSDPRVQLIEAYSETGVFPTRFANFSLAGNSRVVLYRPKSPISAISAHKAAHSIYQLAKKFQQASMEKAGRKKLKLKDNYPYDLKMEFEEHSKIFCSEVVSLAYKTVSVKLPTFPSSLRRTEFLDRLGVEVDETFAPADIEVEPQFELIAEWRDIRKIESALKKDRILASMYTWMESGAYTATPSKIENILSKVAYGVRKHNIALHKLLSPQLTPKQIAAFVVISLDGLKLEKKLKQFEIHYKRNNNGVLPSFYDQAQELEKYKDL